MRQKFLMELLARPCTFQQVLFLPALEYIIAFVCQQANPGNLHKTAEPCLHQGTQLIRRKFLPGDKRHFRIFHRINLHADFTKFIQCRKYRIARFLFHQIALMEGNFRTFLRGRIYFYTAGQDLPEALIVFQQETLSSKEFSCHS